MWFCSMLDPTGGLPKNLNSELNMSLFITNRRQPIKIKSSRKVWDVSYPTITLETLSIQKSWCLLKDIPLTPSRIKRLHLSGKRSPDHPSKRIPVPQQMIDRCACVWVGQAWLIHSFLSVWWWWWWLDVLNWIREVQRELTQFWGAYQFRADQSGFSCFRTYWLTTRTINEGYLTFKEQ